MLLVTREESQFESCQNKMERRIEDSYYFKESFKLQQSMQREESKPQNEHPAAIFSVGKCVIKSNFRFGDWA